MSSTGIQHIVDKLDAFIRKFYKNELLKGAMLFVGLGILAFLVVTSLEAVGRFDGITRQLLFFSFIGCIGVILFKYVLVPLSKLLQLTKTINHDQAAEILGKHFPEVNDKLLNTLQLHREAANDSNELLIASIEARVKSLNPVPFSSAIKFSDNRRYLKFVVIPASVLVLLLFTNASWITEPSERLVNYNKSYEPPAPYSIQLENESLDVVEQESIQLIVKVEGSEVPSSISVLKNGSKFRMKKLSKNRFAYTVKADKSMNLRFTSGEVSSRQYSLNVLPRPSISNFKVLLDYPDYTGKKDEVLEGVGDLNVPEGTVAKWEFDTKNVSELSVVSNSLDTALTKNNLQLSRKLMESERYWVYTSNDYIKNADSSAYLIDVTKDEYPQIDVEEDVDSNNAAIRYFMGQVADDYGVSALSFTVNFRKGERKGKSETKTVHVSQNALAEQFMHYINFDDLKLMPGDEVSYFFTVWDNDGVNGRKSVSTGSRVFQMKSEEELEKEFSSKTENTLSEMEQAINEASKLKKEMDALKNEMSNSKSMSWQQKEKLQSLLDKQLSLQEQVEKLKEEFKKNNEDQEKYKELKEETQEKRDQLEELMDELFTPEMKEMLEELQKLMQELNKDQIQNNMEQISMENEDMKNELERALEHMKELQFQEKLDDLIKKSEELAKEQKDLGEKMEDKEISKEEAEKKQDEIDKKMEDLKDKMEEIKEKNDKLGKKHDMEESEKKQEESEQSQKESEQQLQNNKMKKAGQEQQKAGESMEQMSKEMQSMQASASQQQQQEDMDALRQLLENLIEMSFTQEEVMDDIEGLSAHDPQYFEVGRKQRKLLDDSQIIKDSLLALSKRVMQIQPIVNKEISEINYYMDKTLEDIGERRTNEAKYKQQVIMTSTNNLALLLDEALKQMQQQMASQMPGTGQCQKPGGNGKPSSIPSLQEMQEQLSKQLEKMKKGMQDGQKSGDKSGNKPGDKPGDKSGNKPGDGKQGGNGGDAPGEGQSESMAKLAAQQAAIREQIKKLKQALNEDGSGNGNGLDKVIEDMEKTEEDIIFNKISDKTLMRQKDILTRLLEHEKAERERDQEEKRESKEAKNDEISNPEKFLEYKRRKQKELEMLRTIPPDLRIYYKQKVNAYFNSADL